MPKAATARAALLLGALGISTVVRVGGGARVDGGGGGGDGGDGGEANGGQSHVSTQSLQVVSHWRQRSQRMHALQTSHSWICVALYRFGSFSTG
jgi:hypothetical protein